MYLSILKKVNFTKAPTVNLVGVDNVNIDNVSEIKLTVSKDTYTNGEGVQEEVATRIVIK